MEVKQQILNSTAAACSACKGEDQDRIYGEDRISTLPDEIIHDIIARLQPHKQAWKAAVLSKRWTQLFRSYPILEFNDDHYYYSPRESLHRFAKATVEKFSQQQQGNMISLEAVRVKVQICTEFYSELHDRILELAARCSLREIDIGFGHGYCGSCGTAESSVLPYNIPKSFFIPSQPNSRQFLRLRVLKLSDCNFDEFKDVEETDNLFSGLGSSLKELCLENVCFPYYDNECECGGVKILNSMIAGASLLERLTLVNIRCINMIQIRNHGNIKVMQVTNMCVKDFEITGAPSLKILSLTDMYVEDFEITGASSLERLSLIGSDMDNIHISSTPNLKSLCISGGDWDEQAISRLTADIPSLEFLKLNDAEYEPHIVYSNDNDGEVYSDEDV